MCTWPPLLGGSTAGQLVQKHFSQYRLCTHCCCRLKIIYQSSVTRVSADPLIPVCSQGRRQVRRPRGRAGQPRATGHPAQRCRRPLRGGAAFIHADSVPCPCSLPTVHASSSLQHDSCGYANVVDILLYRFCGRPTRVCPSHLPIYCIRSLRQSMLSLREPWLSVLAGCAAEQYCPLCGCCASGNVSASHSMQMTFARRWRTT